MTTITEGMTPTQFLAAMNDNFAHIPGCATLTVSSKESDFNANYDTILNLCPLNSFTDLTAGLTAMQYKNRLEANFQNIENFAMSVEITTADADQAITLPFIYSEGYLVSVYNCKVDFGDGSPLVAITAYNDTDITHSYAVAGKYNIKIYGKCPSFYVGDGTIAPINDKAIKPFITKINNWGNVGIRAVNFKGCSNLTEMPTDTYKAFSLCVYMDNAFQLTGMSVIPTGLLDYATNVINLGFAFSGDDQDYYTSLFHTIPTGLLDHCTKLTQIVAMFQCACINEIPPGLLDNCPDLTSVGYMFKKCPLSVIPTGFFDHNPKITYMRETFLGTDVSVIPPHLFDHNPLVTDMAYIFSMLKITTVPAEIFKYNTLVTTFYGIFWKTPTLISIPDDLFSYSPLAEDMEILFCGCTNLQNIPSNIFANNPSITSFRQVFNGCINATGAGPRIWETYLTANLDNCYGGCINLSNYGDIPENYKVFVPVYI